MLRSIWITTRWAVVPIFIGIICSAFLFPDLYLENERLHITLEGAGATIGLYSHSQSVY